MGAHDASIEFNSGSLDPGGVHNRPATRHYLIDRGKVTRLDPYALRPRDFVDEWLQQDWIASAQWSESLRRVAMRDWYKTIHKDKSLVFGEFIYPTMHRPSRPDLWQVGIDFSDPPTPIGPPPKRTYFLVRWRPPYTFRMVDVSDHPFSGCTEEDRQADDAPQTLFPNRQ